MALTTEAFERPGVKKREKTIYIRRKISFVQSAQSGDAEVKEYFDSAFRAIGSSFKEFGTQLQTGLNYEEEGILMGMLFGVDRDRDAKQYQDEVIRFYKNINTKVPPEGLKLNIALTKDDDGEISKDNLPVEPDDYVRYRHALVHLNVAPSLEEAQMYQHKLFYIDDPETVNKDKIKLGKVKDEAAYAFLELKQNPDKVSTVLYLMGQKPDTTMTEEERYEELRKFTDLNPDLNAEGNIQRFERLISAIEDKRGETKYLILRMVDAGILDRVGERIVVVESGDEIGVGLEDAALFFADKKNGKEVNMWKTKLKELGK